MKPIEWDIRREGRRWSHEESDQRCYQAPEKIEYVDGIFASDRQRLIVLGMLLENLGIDRAIRYGKLELEFCILSERKAYRLPDRPFGDRNARRNSGASRQVDHVII